MTKITRAEIEKGLRLVIDDLQIVKENLQRELGEKRRQLDSVTKEITNTRDQFDDLKQRLLISETEVARLAGYIARVQEDDIAHEPLVKVGNEDNQQLVPKRKFQLFSKVGNSTAELHGNYEAAVGHRSWRDSTPAAPKHWISY